MSKENDKNEEDATSEIGPWTTVDEIKRRMGYNTAYSLPEGTVLAYRSRKQPHHNWHYGIYIENDSKARDQFRVGKCILLHWPLPREDPKMYTEAEVGHLVKNILLDIEQSLEILSVGKIKVGLLEFAAKHGITL